MEDEVIPAADPAPAEDVSAKLQLMEAELLKERKLRQEADKQSAERKRELARLNEEYKTKLSPEEARALSEKDIQARMSEREKEFQERIEQLEHNAAVATYSKMFTAELGFKQVEADDAAEYAYSKETDKLIALIKKAYDRREGEKKEERTNLLGRLPVGNVTPPTPKKDLPPKMTERERREKILSKFK